MIICGFPGVGKSSICRTIPNYTDLESTPFKKNWEVYVDVIEYMNKNHYNVFVSSHIQLREELKKRKLDYIFVVPEKDLKEEYIKRYKERGNTDTFIKQISDNWDTYTDSVEDEKVYRLGTDTYLFDILPLINLRYKINKDGEEVDFLNKNIEEIKEDIGGNFSSNFSSFAPEKVKGIISLVDDQSIEDLQAKPEPLPEKVINDIKDISIDDLCDD